MMLSPWAKIIQHLCSNSSYTNAVWDLFALSTLGEQCKMEQESNTLSNIGSISTIQGEFYELSSLYINTSRGQVSTLEIIMSPYFNIKLKLDVKVQSELKLAPRFTVFI